MTTETFEGTDGCRSTGMGRRWTRERGVGGVECSYSALESAARDFFSGFTGVALRWRFFSRRLLLLLRAGISSLRHYTTRAITFSDLAPAS